MTAGKGIARAGEAERWIPGDAAPNDDLLLEGAWDGGFIGSARDCGVPGIDGAGEPIRIGPSRCKLDRCPKSGGAGLFDDGRRSGKSILLTLLCCVRVN